ncbi:MAG: ABC transporter permease [Bacteroidota bacterium]
MTPNQLAWRKYRRNLPAMLGLVYVCLCLLVALLGYWIVPDYTRNANFQALELAKLGPGSEGHMLLLPLLGVETDPSIGERWLGADQPYLPIVLKDTASVAIAGEYVSYTALSGADDRKRLSDFGVEGTISKASFLAEYATVRRYWLGTDNYGRDLLSRILLGTRISLSIGIMSVLISLLIGIVLGTFAGYFGGWVDAVIMWLVSVMWSIPTLLLALAIVFVLEKGFWQLFLAIGVSMWVEVARIVRGQILSVREQAFAEAAGALGFKHPRIMFRHVLPNVLSPIIVVAVANFGSAVLIESGLSFLGIGVEVPIPTWGRMIYEGYTYIVFENGKWLAFFPGLALILLVVSINLIGIGLRDALDVKLN